ncbi:MAG: RecX family transcriptional regulator [Anaerolineae bacterium]|nr:MAG: RecX family transcriptional regulator [Anaerolineae bacterium]
MGKKVTALKVQKRNPNRVNVYLDGEFAFGLARIVAVWLSIGQELSDYKISEMRAKDETEVALQRALNFLSFKPRTEQEVRENLKKKEVADSVQDEIISRLRTNGLLNDEQFAGMWVENRSEFRPRGGRALRMELRQKGVAETTIEKALDGLNEEPLALNAGLKQARRYRGLEYDEFRKKMYGFLGRRGFSYDIIQSVVPQVWAQQEGSQPENQFSDNEVDP